MYSASPELWISASNLGTGSFIGYKCGSVWKSCDPNEIGLSISFDPELNWGLRRFGGLIFKTNYKIRTTFKYTKQKNQIKLEVLYILTL